MSDMGVYILRRETWQQEELQIFQMTFLKSESDTRLLPSKFNVAWLGLQWTAEHKECSNCTRNEAVQKGVRCTIYIHSNLRAINPCFIHIVAT